MVEEKKEEKTLREEAQEFLKEVKETETYKKMSSNLKQILEKTVDKVSSVLKESGKEAVDVVADTVTESVKESIKEKDNKNERSRTKEN